MQINFSIYDRNLGLTIFFMNKQLLEMKIKLFEHVSRYIILAPSKIFALVVPLVKILKI